MWDEYCSWYIELSKDRLAEPDSASALTAKYILLDVMQQGMRLLHPIMPFITEEIWQGIKTLFPIEEEALIIAAFPDADESLIDPDIADDMSFIQESISAIRNLRKQVNLAPSKGVQIHVRVAEARQAQLFEKYQTYLQGLAKVEELNTGVDIQKPRACLAAVVRNIEIFMPLSGLIDIEAEKQRLGKQVEKIEKELASIDAKLNNPNFVNNAKPEVVEDHRKRREDVEVKLSLTKELLADL